MNHSSARRSLSAIRYAAHHLKQNLLVVQWGEFVDRQRSGRRGLSSSLASERRTGQGIGRGRTAGPAIAQVQPPQRGAQWVLRAVERQHNKRLELTPRVDYGTNLFSARRSSAAIR